MDVCGFAADSGEREVAIRRKEYIFYAVYVIFVTVYFLNKYLADEKGVVHLGVFNYYELYPDKILVTVSFCFYFKFAMNGVIAAKLLEYFQKEAKNSTALKKAILQSLVRGLSYKKIAAEALISVETLDSHIKNIYRKLDVHSRSELAAKYGRSF